MWVNNSCGVDGGRIVEKDGLWAVLSQNVYELRCRYGLSRKEMAHILGIGEKSLQKVESGVMVRSFTAATLCRLAYHFQISTDSLLYGKVEEWDKKAACGSPRVVFQLPKAWECG